MILCRSCLAAWPDNAAYCGKCQRSFKGRLCPKGHLSPKSASCCIVCGSNDLSAYTDSLSFGPLAKVAAWILCLALVRPAWPVISLVFGGLWMAIDWLFGLVTGLRMSQLLAGLLAQMLCVATPFALVALFFPRSRPYLARALKSSAHLVSALVRLILPAARFGFRLINSLVQGKPHEKPQLKKR